VKLALFDLDHTLLSGDSDVLWCEFLMQQGVLDRAEFEPRNADMARRYADASVTVQDFCDFYVGTLAGRSLAQWQPLCDQFLTTATNRVITGMTAKFLGFDNLIATEVALDGGVCTGRTSGTLNMREGKVTRLRGWLAERNLPPALLAEAVFYSDSSNDLPLLSAVGEPIPVDPDTGLLAHARAAGWRLLALAR
jgi:phosphoserine phosphatase